MANEHRAAASVKEGPGLGAAIAITLYGLAIVFLDAAAKVSLVPSSNGLIAVVMAAVAIVGALLGGAVDRARG